MFAFLVGVAIYYRQFNKPKIKVFWYCLILGPLYIFLDVVLISFGYTFNTNFNKFYIQILYTIGVGLLVLSIFLFLTGALSVWVVMLLPIYFFVVLQGASVEAAVSIVVLYSIILSVIYFIRVQRGKWRSLSISSTLPLRTE